MCSDGGWVPFCPEVEEASSEPAAMWVTPDGGRSRHQSARATRSPTEADLQIARRSVVA